MRAPLAVFVTLLAACGGGASSTGSDATSADASGRDGAAGVDAPACQAPAPLTIGEPFVGAPGPTTLALLVGASAGVSPTDQHGGSLLMDVPAVPHTVDFATTYAGGITSADQADALMISWAPAPGTPATEYFVSRAGTLTVSEFTPPPAALGAPVQGTVSMSWQGVELVQVDRDELGDITPRASACVLTVTDETFTDLPVESGAG